MKKNLAKRTKKERGIALIILVFFILLLLIASITQMLVTTGTQLQDANLELARIYSQEAAQSAISNIRKALDKDITTKLNFALADHLNKDYRARFFPAGNPNSIYQCQGPIDTSLVEISEIYSLCDPINLLGGKTPFLTKNDDTINDLAKFLPSNVPPNPNIYFSSALNEIKRESFNNFDYTVDIEYVGQELLQQGYPRLGRRPPVARIERYKWMARADLFLHTYEDIYTKYIVEFDIVTTVHIYDEPVNCGNNYPTGGNCCFAGFPLMMVVKCVDPTKGPYDPDCPKVIVGTPSLDPTGVYKDTCTDPTKPGIDTCQATAQQICPQETIEAGLCPVAPGAVFKGSTSNQGTYTSTGCKTRNALATGTGGYLWTTAIRTTSLGNAY